MMTFKEYCEQFAESKEFKRIEIMYGFGVHGNTLEEFCKGYSKLAIEAQAKECSENYELESDDWNSKVSNKIKSTLIELI